MDWNEVLLCSLDRNDLKHKRVTYSNFVINSQEKFNSLCPTGNCFINTIDRSLNSSFNEEYLAKYVFCHSERRHSVKREGLRDERLSIQVHIFNEFNN